ncbi:MAG TPA: MFS transporter [Candidatus Sulfotelmatobacter sp.]|nr:MFS transporter [Candidatus Sulfotelmatobacter sp.]
MIRARKNVLLLTLAQALAMTGTIINATTSALAGYALASDKSLATLAVALQFTATMLTTVPASMLMAKIGRRPAFMLGAASQLVGALAAAGALVVGQFSLFCLCGIFLGVANGFSIYYRFAAADTADETFRPKAISLVLAGGVAAALVGPEFARWSRDLLLPYTYAGTFVTLAAMALVNLAVLSRLDIPKPPPARFTGGRPLLAIAAQPLFLVAVATGMVAYGTMSLLMTATPLAMAACSWRFEDSAFVIQWHALGMFAPAFFTGHLIRRFGVLAIMRGGAAIVALCLAVDLSGVAVMNFWVGLALLGVGWNFMFVGATTLLTETYRPEERAKVQAINDFCVFSGSATAAFSAGALQFHVGWSAMNWGVVPLITAAFVGLMLVRRAAPRPAVA